ncbi:MAG: regulator of RNase E activity RraB, partial [Shewanella sp.]
CESLLLLAAKHKVDYDGWGTYFIDENGEEIREEDFEDDDFEDDDYEADELQEEEKKPLH